ncbi:hypothetical protein [Ruminiclostridium cellobioparum]|uniref:Ribosome-binding factor A n=1 Tax=Ruminiclostridium cellobioparum subsp. termitidis CT1112 TaxID=1195236 RepID=S0FK32_RUMCE|nr:hypothetical protein [Ruminiclostridium cellobioparum]EMS69509.1 hypothetical protein CTER_4602 [Ruminiclostridium cellobioparum subsp. termitidis CT1112]
MLIKQKKKNEENNDLLERIKSEIQSQLGNRGVAVSGINMQINPNNISLSIYISGSRRLA